ncbi:MAG: DUF3107 family protein [Acidobacteria bacterium]|nr:DUF3107 family protein [Acidobacteriota bacterium]
MDVRIGIVQSMKEIELEMDDDTDRGGLEGQVEAALTGETVLWLTDRKGRRVGIPASKIAYLEIGPASAERRVGFGA